MKNIKIAQVVPYARLKNNLDFFSYAISEELKFDIKIGSIVEINFRNKNILGLVVGFKKETNETIINKLKNIYRINPEFIQLNEWQVKLMKQVCEHFMISYSLIFKLLIPSIPKRITKDNISSKEHLFVKNHSTISIKLKEKNLVKYRYNNTLISFINKICKELKDDEQVAIIFPRLSLLHKISKALKFDVNIFLNSLNKNQYYKSWKKIKNGESKVILGIKNVIFAPYKNISHIIVVDEDSFNTNQVELLPKYNLKYVINLIYKLTNCKLTLLSRSPSLSSLYDVANKELEYFNIDNKINLPLIKVIDINKEKLSINSSLSLTLYHAVKRSLKGGNKIFLYLNKKGGYTGYYCFDCKKQYSIGDFNLTCPSCNGVNFSKIGIGIQELKKEITNLFPYYKVEAIDSDSKINEDLIQEIISSSQVVIGTDYAKDYINFNEINIVGVISYDILNNKDNYNVNEIQFCSIYELISRLNNSQKLFIQTKDSQNPNIISLYNYNLKSFYKNEIEERKIFNYPPIANLFKITFNMLDIGEVSKIYKKLNIIFSNAIMISKPMFINNQYQIMVVMNKDSIFNRDKLRNLDIKIDIL